MSLNDIRKKFLNFYQERDHVTIPSVSLVPEDDPTTLFTSSGMQQLVPYFLGKKHAKGHRIANAQKCFRAVDIEEVGDNRHTTFFEMLGNWSLGDPEAKDGIGEIGYFKKEQLNWVFQFLTKEVGLDPERLYVSAFIGNSTFNIPKDEEAVEIWKEVFSDVGIDAKAIELGSAKEAAQKGMQGGRIFYYDEEENWWSRAGGPKDMPAGEPGGPDSEIFYEFPEVEHDSAFGDYCHPACDCGRFLEIGNSVFMEYEKKEDGSLGVLKQKNIDFGGGLERIAMAAQGVSSIFEIDAIAPMISKLPDEMDMEMSRVFADHIRAIIFLVADGVRPSNKEQGYILRRLIRRLVAIRDIDVRPLFDEVEGVYQEHYPEVNAGNASLVFSEEKKKFEKALRKGLKELERMGKVDAESAFKLYQSFGLPYDVIKAKAGEKAKDLTEEAFDKEFEKHQEISRAGAEEKFGGHGLALDTGELKAKDDKEKQAVLRLHTATHMLQQALREVLGDEVAQAGSNINAKRTRFDFTFPRKVEEDELREVERIVNQKISEDQPVQFKEMPKEEAEKTGALSFFKAKYPDVVRIYYIGDTLESAWSKEFCGGPHVGRTGEIGGIEVFKEESASAGVRRIRARLTE